MAVNFCHLLCSQSWQQASYLKVFKTLVSVSTQSQVQVGLCVQKNFLKFIPIYPEIC